MYELCRTLLECGRYQEGEGLARGIVEDQIDILGESDASTLRTQSVLGDLWRIFELYESAAFIETRVLQIAKELLGPNIGQTIEAMAKLAWTWRSLGKYEEAEQAEIQVLELRIENLGRKHPDTMEAVEQLG